METALLQSVVTAVLASGAAGALPRMPWQLGLRRREQRQVQAIFPEATALWTELSARSPDTAFDGDTSLLMPLRDYLLTQREGSRPELTVLSNALACGCFGGHHLWQDLGVSDRSNVSQLLATAFPPLHASNVHNLRWKRHLFACLGEHLSRGELRPPKCAGCEDFTVCFGAAPIDERTSWRIGVAP